ncbi:MAG: hypothetical protein ACYCUG_12020 [Acidimicrobiales bacterium]
MILFVRKVSTWGDPRETGAWARRMTELATKESAAPPALWVGLSGTAPGTFLFTGFFQGLAEFTATAATLGADPEWLDGVAAARQHTAAPPEDRHIEIIHTAGGEYSRPPVGGVVQWTVATPAAGKLGAAIVWGLELAELVAEILGRPVLFGNTLAGPFGELNWIGATTDAAAADVNREALTKDGRYLAKVDEGSGLFQVDSARNSIYRRVA